MALEDLLERLRKHPFQPFRIRLRNGRQHEVCHRHVSLVLRSSVLLDRVESPDPDRLLTISEDELESIEPVH